MNGWHTTAFPRLIAIVMVAVLAGCGFQLRGQVKLPESMQTLAVRAPDQTTTFVRTLIGQLRANGVAINPSSEAASPRLVIERERLYRQALTISQDARVREYVLYLEVRYHVVDALGNPIVEPQTLRLSRDYQFDEQAILGGSREEEFLGDDLSRAMASQLVRQLSALLSERS